MTGRSPSPACSSNCKERAGRRLRRGHHRLLRRYRARCGAQPCRCSGARALRSRRRHGRLPGPALHRRDDAGALARADRESGPALRHGRPRKVRAADIPVLELEDPASERHCEAARRDRAGTPRRPARRRSCSAVPAWPTWRASCRQIYGVPVVDGVAARGQAGGSAGGAGAVDQQARLLRHRRWPSPLQAR